MFHKTQEQQQGVGACIAGRVDNPTQAMVWLVISLGLVLQGSGKVIVAGGAIWFSL